VLPFSLRKSRMASTITFVALLAGYPNTPVHKAGIAMLWYFLSSVLSFPCLFIHPCLYFIVLQGVKAFRKNVMIMFQQRTGKNKCTWEKYFVVLLGTWIVKWLLMQHKQIFQSIFKRSDYWVYFTTLYQYIKFNTQWLGYKYIWKKMHLKCFWTPGTMHWF
jgi:hypothetical protein